MAFTSLTAAQTLAGAAWTQTTADLIRTNEDDLDARLQAAELFTITSDQDIRDDFIKSGSAIDTNLWTSVIGASDTTTIVSEHQLKCLTSGVTTSDYAGVEAHTNKMRIDKSMDLIAFCEARVKVVGGLAPDYLFGFQDVSLTGASTLYSTITNCIVFRRHTDDNWNQHSQLGGASYIIGSTASVSSWQTLRMEITCSATPGLREVNWFVNGTPNGPATTDVFMPTATLVPVAGTRADGTSTARDVRFNYLRFGFKSIPASA